MRVVDEIVKVKAKVEESSRLEGSTTVVHILEPETQQKQLLYTFEKYIC